MSVSSKPRVVRRHAPPFVLRKSTYGKALEFLLLDFADRCAYSLQHKSRCEMEVDHFDPARKKDDIQKYENLFPSSGHCNRAKGNTPPYGREASRGIRLLNCCRETDYDCVIFEDPETHELVGTTKAARYHIEILDLNAPFLVAERRRRTEYRAKLGRGPIQCSTSAGFAKLTEVINAFKREVETMIPPIKPPPRT